MTTNEKLAEFQRAFEKISTVLDRILNRLNLNNLKLDQETSLGLHKLNVNGTDYYYYPIVVKQRCHDPGSKYSLAVKCFYYTIQAHECNNRKYVIVFYPNLVENRTPKVSRIEEIEGHVFARYKERFLKDLDSSFNDAITKYLINNVDGKIDIFGRDDMEVAKISNDGISLGMIIDNYMLQLKTFIVEEQLRENQKLWSKYGNMWIEYKKEYEDNKNNPVKIKTQPIMRRR